MLVESQLQTVRKEKGTLEQETKAQKEQLEAVTPLVATVRELHGLCKEANKKIKSLSEDSKDQIKIPKLDKDLLESLEKAAESDESDAKDKKESKDSKTAKSKKA